MKPDFCPCGRNPEISLLCRTAHVKLRKKYAEEEAKKLNLISESNMVQKFVDYPSSSCGHKESYLICRQPHCEDCKGKVKKIKCY